MPTQSPLENRPRGPRRVLQKIWADKDLRDAIIQQLEQQLGHGVKSFGLTIHVNALESGTFNVNFKARSEGTHRHRFTDAITNQRKSHENCRQENAR